MRISDGLGNQWTFELRHHLTVAHQIDGWARMIMSTRGTSPVLVEMRRDEAVGTVMPVEIMGIQVRIIDDPSVLPRPEVVNFATFRLLTADIRRRILLDAARRVGLFSGFDEIYRRHGGTKRPPSKLHPLVQLDEQLRQQAEEAS